MLCEQCKMREANVVIREVAGGNVSERRLCSQCAAASELGGFLDGTSAFARLLSGIMGFAAGGEEEGDQEAGELSCPVCGMSYEEFKQSGRFGCSECYSAFGPLIYGNIKNLQGGTSHTGKKPARAEKKKLIEALPSGKKEPDPREQVEIYLEKQKEAVQAEDYEKAAWYRDEIRKLRERIDAS